MATYRLSILVMALFFVEKCYCQANSNILLTPEKLNLTPNTSSTGGSMQIKCEVQNMGQDESLSGLIIYRRLDSSGANDEREAVVSAANGVNNGLPRLRFNIPGASVFGNIADKFISLSLTQAKCEDAGNFTCRVTALVNIDEFKPFESVQHLSVEVSAGPIVLTPDPRGIDNWKLYDTLSMLCNGAVGTVIPGITKIEWVWEYRDGSILGSQWQEYAVKESSDDIVKQDCFEYQSSTLELNLTLADTDRIYRCYIKRDSISLTQFAATHAVGTVTTTGVVTTTSSIPSSGDNQPSKSEAGPIIGGVIGGLVVLVVVIIVIVVIVKRRNSNKDKGDDYAAEDPSHTSSGTTGPYTSTDSEVAYSQPHRDRRDKEKDREPRTLTITGMDNMGDKPFSYEPKPARYANDFGQTRDYNPGRRNQAYDSDADSHGRRHHSNDDGDTHSRSNLSHLSIGDGDPTIGTAI